MVFSGHIREQTFPESLGDVVIIVRALVRPYFLGLTHPFSGVGVIGKYVWEVDEPEFPGCLNGKNGTAPLKLGLPWTTQTVYSACLPKCGVETTKLENFGQGSLCHRFYGVKV